MGGSRRPLREQREQRETFALDVGVAQVIERAHGTIAAREVEDVGLRPPPGDELFRFATVSDTHIGLEEFGFWPTVHDPLTGGDPPSERCLRAAVSEAAAWGAQLLVAKGDLAEHGSVDEVERVLALLREPGIPVDAMLGNHEVKRASARIVSMLGASDAVRVRDVPGARLVLFDSTVAGHHRGTYAPRTDEVVEAVAEVATPAVLLTHHHPQPLPVPHHWPPGVPSPEARRFLDRVADANPRALLTAGHTHRHRRRHHRSIVITEVGSTQHFPGTWAGYVVHEGGIRQVVRRVAAPEAIAWTEATRRSVLRVWARWSPGRISDRCFSHTW